MGGVMEEKYEIALKEGEEREKIVNAVVEFTKENLHAFTVDGVLINIEPDYAILRAPDRKTLNRWVRNWKEFLEAV